MPFILKKIVLFKHTPTGLPIFFSRSFRLKFRGEYFAYSTGFDSDGKVFSVLHSRDLVTWSAAGGAMDPLPDNPPFYWAPEVTCLNGKFYLYYSVGNEILMEIRVAVSDNPAGGFIDSGSRLTFQDFAIDATYLSMTPVTFMFYATDFLDHTHMEPDGVDRIDRPFTLEGRPRPVTRARYAGRFMTRRKEKGGVRWHTVEGHSLLNEKVSLRNV